MECQTIPNFTLARYDTDDCDYSQKPEAYANHLHLATVKS